MNEKQELTLTQKATQALANAVAKVVEDHRQRGRPLAVWRDGKAVWMPSNEAASVRETHGDYRTRTDGAKQ